MYQVLYRKYRPKIFSDVVGQNHITSTLSREIETGKLSHAYLFTGSRGTGKTTCAKILSKAVNCLNPQNGNPCNECEICKGIDSGAILDVAEIDAASNNGVDNIRDIREEVNFTPASCKYRVYIIDEVHMLSLPAFNALLKTLEEPPAHVKFILATTEVHKLPVTIISRCQRFDFKRVTPEAMNDRMKYICQEENVTIDDDALSLIARVADGGMRDALSLLDQCTGQAGHITAEIVCSVAGMTGRDHLFSIADAVSAHDSAKMLDLIDNLHTNSYDMERLCNDLIDHFRNLMVTKTVKSSVGLIVGTDAELLQYKKQSESFTLQTILYCISLLQQSLANIKSGVNRRIEMEMTAIKLATPSLCDENEAILSRLAALERAIKNGVKVQATATTESATKAPEQAVTEKPAQAVSSAEAEAPKENEPQQQSSPAEAQPQGDSEGSIEWAEVLSELMKTNMPLWGVLSSSSAVVRGDYVLIKSDNPTLGEFIRKQGNARDVKDAIEKVMGKRYRLGLYNNNSAPAANNAKPATPPVAQKDPLQNLIANAMGAGIPVDVTE